MFSNEQFQILWKTKKFERFNYFVLEKMSLMEKLAFVKDVYVVPKGIAADIESINAIRNAVAHAFFPENLRAYRSKPGGTARQFAGPPYKGVDVFTFDGFGRFVADARRVVEFMVMDTRRKRAKKASTTIDAPPTDGPLRPGTGAECPSTH